MTSEEYIKILKGKGFVYKESQEAWTQHRGQEHKFTHPAFKHYFYVKRISDEDDSPWGFNAQVVNGKLFDDIYPHNAVDTFRDKGLFMWVDEAFVELMKGCRMRSWVISSNPNTYQFKPAMAENGYVDWVTKNKFEVGDTVYVYEVASSKEGGGIIYKTEVTMTDLTRKNKPDDSQFWSGKVYPQDITDQTEFSRLKFVGEPNSDNLTFRALRERGFTAPQSKAHILDKKPDLLRYIKSHFV